MRVKSIIGIAFFALFFIGVCSSSPQATKFAAAQTPSAASAMASQSGNVPAANAQLYAGNSYNFTTYANTSVFGQTIDSANLQITQSGDTVANLTSTPLGSYNNCTDSFQNDAVGGLAQGFTYSISGTGSASVVASYLGHQQVLSVTDTSGSSYALYTFPVVASVWHGIRVVGNYVRGKCQRAISV